MKLQRMTEEQARDEMLKMGEECRITLDALVNAMHGGDPPLVIIQLGVEFGRAAAILTLHSGLIAGTAATLEAVADQTERR